jgi:cell division protein FtsZ
MVMPGLINLDFADVRSVMGEMGKAMMGTGEASGDNRAIEAAEQAIANPLLDGVSMKGARGVIISITGGEDMRLMEVDEAASHIKELVDPDANIIWGSAFNNDLDGKIRVSVVATGIDAEAVTVPAAPAKVFAFPSARSVESKPAAAPAVTLTPPETMIEDEAPTAEVAEPEAEPEASTADADELDLATEAEAEAEEDELLLGDMDMVAEEPTPEEPQDEAPAPTGNRSWLSREEEPAPAAKPVREGGTLFERMSNIARGAAKAQVEEEAPAPRLRTARDPLDIPRFLNRQNNQ